MTLKRLRVLKAEEDFAHFDELINKTLDNYEGYNHSDCFASSQPSHKSKRQHIQSKEKRK